MGSSNQPSSIFPPSHNQPSPNQPSSNYLMQSLTPSPSGKLISLKTASSSFNHVCIDLTGQYFYMTENRQTQGIYFLLCVSTHFAGETKIIPIPNKTVLAILT